MLLCVFTDFAMYLSAACMFSLPLLSHSRIRKCLTGISFDTLSSTAFRYSNIFSFEKLFLSISTLSKQSSYSSTAYTKPVRIL